MLPPNIVLIFLPSYSPELNPAEKVWQVFKRKFSNQFFKTMNDLENFVTSMAIGLNQDQIKSICGFKYIFQEQFWSVM